MVVIDGRATLEGSSHALGSATDTLLLTELRRSPTRC